MADRQSGQSPKIINRKAFHEYEIMDRYEAGIVLQGTEVKSLRQGKANFKDAFAHIKDDEAWIYNMHISPYSHGTVWNHDTTRPRKLLLHKQEIKRLKSQVEEKGLTLTPLQIYFKKGRAKIELGLARGKKLYDKRKDLAKKDAHRDTERELKNKFRVKL